MGSFWIDLSNLFLCVYVSSHIHPEYICLGFFYFYCVHIRSDTYLFFVFVYLFYSFFCLLCTSLSFPFFYFIAPNKVIPRKCISCARPHINQTEIVILTRKRSITAIFLHTITDRRKNKQGPFIFVKTAWKHVCVRKKWPESILNRIIHTEHTRPPRNPSTLDRNDGYLWYDCGWSVP